MGLQPSHIGLQPSHIGLQHDAAVEQKAHQLQRAVAQTVALRRHGHEVLKQG